MMQQNKFSTPRHMSRSALPIMYVNYLRSEWEQLLAIIALVFLSSDGLTFLQKILYPVLGLLIYLLYLALRTFLKYHFFTFHVSEGNLIVEKGMLHRQTINIPTYKIYSLRTKSGFFYRLFDMKGISADTLADKEKEVELILDDADWDELLEMFKDERIVPEDSLNDDAVKQQEGAEEKNDIVYNNLSLIKGALCQNHLKGTVIMAVVVFNVLLQIDESILGMAAEYAAEEARTVSFTLTSILVLIVCIYLISIIVWLAKIVLSYYNLNIRFSADRLFFEGGLITRRSIRFAYDKVCTIIVKVNPLEKLMRCSTVQLKQAFNVTSEKEQNDVLVYGSSITDSFLKWWLGSSFEQSSVIYDVHSGRGMFWYSLKYPLIITLAASFILYKVQLTEYLPLLGIILIIFIVQSILKTRRSHVVVRDGYIEIHNGSFAEVRHYIKFENIETVAVRHTPFTPYFHRVHLMLSTNGTGFVIRSLRYDEAMTVYDHILSEIYRTEY